MDTGGAWLVGRWRLRWVLKRSSQERRRTGPGRGRGIGRPKLSRTKLNQAQTGARRAGDRQKRERESETVGGRANVMSYCKGPAVPGERSQLAQGREQEMEKRWRGSKKEERKQAHFGKGKEGQSHSEKAQS